MSLGWQTESAILPSKSKPINVDGKSLLHLKALVYEKEKNIQTSDKYVKNKFKSLPKKNVDIFEKKNSGIEERNKKDALKSSGISNKGENNSISNEVVEKSLQVKAKLYEDMVNGKIANKSTPFLIDFKNKRKLNDISDRSNDKSNVISNVEQPIEKSLEQAIDKVLDSIKVNNYINENNDLIEIEDDFGRVRKVNKSSNEYLQYLINQKSKKYKETLNNSNHYENDDNSNTNQWKWSKGTDHLQESHINENITNKSYEEFLSNNIDTRIKQDVLNSNQSKIKTMWEKTLESSAREYLDEIHQSVEDTRNNNNNNSNINDIIDERKELLKRKQEERKKLLNKNDSV